MEYLSNSCDEKPRAAPVPASFSGGPIIPGVPEVSLVFSPSPARRLDLSSVPKVCISKTPFKNELNQENKLNPVMSKDAEIFNLSPLLSHSKKRSSPKEAMLKSSLSQNGPRNLESVSEMANRIMKENTRVEPHCFLGSDSNFERGTSIQGNLKTRVDNIMSENGGKQFHMAGSLASENGERYRQRYPEKYGNKPYSNFSGQLRSINGHLAHTNVYVERNVTDHTPTVPLLTDQTNMIPCHCKSHQISKQCFFRNSPRFESDVRCTSNSITPCHGNDKCVACSNCINDGDASSNIASCNTSHFKALSDNPHLNAVKYSSCLCSCASSKMYKNNGNCQSHHNNGINYDVSSHPVCNSSEVYTCNASIHNYDNQENTIHDYINDDKIGNPVTSSRNLQKGVIRSTILPKQSSSLKKIEEETINNENIPEKSSSFSNLIQKMVLMNEQQFTVLQGLLQQVVEMQGEQMKVLKEINENLTKQHISDDYIQQHQTHRNIHENDAFTQTSLIENAGSSSEDVKIAKEDEPTNREDSSKDSEIRNALFNNKDSSPKTRNQPPKLVLVPEKEKYKNLRDKAVSWSAIHGVETVEESITLHSIHVPTVEQMPSSVHTMHLHLQDYHSSASFESISESKHSSESNLDNKKSWTLYDNIVGHVKKFLQTVPCDNSGNISQKTSQVEAIRFATIEKIRQLGVSVYENSTEIKEVNTVGRIHFDPNLSPCHSPESSPLNTENNSNEASLELQALAFKYLPADELGDLTKWSQNGRANPISKADQRSNNVSLATQNYLEKYHLLPSFAEIKDTRQMCGDRSPVVAGGNILDITTLKKQPKLL